MPRYTMTVIRTVTEYASITVAADNENAAIAITKSDLHTKRIDPPWDREVQATRFVIEAEDHGD